VGDGGSWKINLAMVRLVRSLFHFLSKGVGACTRILYCTGFCVRTFPNVSKKFVVERNPRTENLLDSNLNVAQESVNPICFGDEKSRDLTAGILRIQSVQTHIFLRNDLILPFQGEF